MDNITHALAGGLIAAGAVSLTGQPAVERAPRFARAAALLGVVAAEFPDIDLAYAGRTLDGGKLAYLLHHRGHTHTVLFALVSAVLLWALTLAAVRECRAGPPRWALLAVAVIGTGSHLLLDFTNSYGVHPFWPFESSWYYGDAVFIVEPWLWIVSLPVIWYFTRITALRVASALALAGILTAAWTISLVGAGVALWLTVGAVVWILVTRAAPANWRWACGVIGWCAVESAFFAASSSARQAVQQAVSASTFRDVALTPSPGNPLCFRALAIQVDGTAYQVTAASVAPFPALRSARGCAGLADVDPDRTVGDSTAGTRTRTPSRAVHWEERWVAPRADLAQLAKQNCEISAALHFMRVPFWRLDSKGEIVLTDLRFGDANGGFAQIQTSLQRTGCVGTVPGWRLPRADILDE